MGWWMKQLSNRGEHTREGYRLYFLKFCQWLGKSPNELIEQKKQTLEHDGDRRENMVLESDVKAFMSYLEYEAVTGRGKTGYGLGTRKLAYAAVLSFFMSNEYPLNMKRGERPSGDAIGSRIPEKAELVKLVNRAKGRRYRAAILFLKDSGLRLSDVVRLRWTAMQDMGEGFYGFKLITQKRRVKAVPFIGPEASEALQQLPHKRGLIFPVNAKFLSRAVGELIREAGLAKGLTAHGLRKYFNTELEAARVPKEHRYAMMGKRVSVYDENRQQRLFQIYRKNYDHLRIFGVVTRDEEIASLKEIIEDQRTKLLQLSENKVTREQFESLKEKLSKLEGLLEQLNG